MTLYTSILAMGLGSGILGPTLLDLRTQVSRDLNEASLTLPARAVGFGLGSFLMGLTYERFNIMLFGAISMALATVTTALIPHILDLYTLLSVFLVNGVFLGSFEAGSNMLLLHLWGKGKFLIRLVVEHFILIFTSNP
jgi:MFS family permease